MAEANGTQACAHCGGPIALRINKTTGEASKARRRYCCAKCKQDARYRRKPKKVRVLPVRTVSCCGCGITGERRVGTNDAARYCSRKCNTDTMARVASEVASLRAIARNDAARAEERRVALVVRAEVFALARISRYIEKPAVFMAECRGCGAAFLARRNGGLYKTKCDGCILGTKRKWRRVAKAKRRARERGADADQIDPIKVFERDRWVCHICKAKTYRELRGTLDSRAPELDHLVTLADGGSHTWGNVACACRSCNHAKGSRSSGQLGLPFAA